MINLFRDFPCDWNYHGDAHLLLDELAFSVTVSLQLRFTDITEVNIDVVWKEEWKEKDNSFTKRYLKLINTDNQVIVIKEKIILMGIITMSNEYASTTNFRCYRMFVYSGWGSNLVSREEGNISFIQLKAYLNNEFSSFDDFTESEFLGLPQSISKALDLNKNSYVSPYCFLNSGYSLKCGKSYVIHNQNTPIRPNIETIYNLSFIGAISKIHMQESCGHITDIIQDFESTIFQCCSFLSILCGYELLPVYYTFTIYSASLNKEIQGKLVPVWEKARIPKLSGAWSKNGIALHHNVEAFLECCPLDKQISNGILQLKTTILDVSAELKLYASCSAIEYFYSYWLRNMGGIQEIESAFFNKSPLLPQNKNFQNLIDQAKKSDGRTPPLSSTIRFFLDTLGIDWKKYLKTSHGKPEFLEVRNNLLHGKYIGGDIIIINSSQIARAVTLKVMLYILERVSKSNENFYTSISIAQPQENSRILPNGWSVIEQALDKFVNDDQQEIFWCQRTKNLWHEIYSNKDKQPG